MNSRSALRPLAFAAFVTIAGSLFGQGPAAPVLNSNPAAKYSLFVNFSGFDYTNVANPAGLGQWGTTGKSPGVVPSYRTDGNGITFSANEVTAIQNTWARLANAFTGFNINVTTVDPAAGLSDPQRQAFYDQKQYFTNQIIGGTYNWYGASGGVSYVGFAQSANVSSGFHTNFVFPVNGTGTSDKAMSAASIHEFGHALRLPHQRDETSGGEYSNNNGASGNGSYAPIMGTTYVSQRGTWRVGSSASGNVNDVARLQGNAGIGDLLDSGRGHSFDTASLMAFTPTGLVDVNNLVNKGFIMPKASANYTAEGVDNYTKDYFSFRSTGGAVTLTVNDGNDLLVRGVADAGATMRSALKIFNAQRQLVATATESTSTLLHTFTGNLDAGDYYAEVSSIGAYIPTYEPNTRYFNMGGYFFTGSGLTAVPEPATVAVLSVGLLAILRRRRKSA